MCKLFLTYSNNCELFSLCCTVIIVFHRLSHLFPVPLCLTYIFAVKGMAFKSNSANCTIFATQKGVGVLHVAYRKINLLIDKDVKMWT